MSKKDLIIREALIPEDFLEIVDLSEPADSGIILSESDSLVEINKKISRDPNLFQIGASDGIIIGSVFGGYDGRRGLEYHMAVSYLDRKISIGEKLMVELEARLRNKGCIHSYLLVTRDNNEALDFYSKRGSRELDLLVMGKDIG